MLGLQGIAIYETLKPKLKKAIECQLALAMNAYRIKKYIGSYTAVMNG
jgi:acetate kinase